MCALATFIALFSDAGFPIPAGVPCINLSMEANLPKVTDVLKMLTLGLPIEQFWFANEIQPSADGRAQELSAIMTKAECIPLPHADFKNWLRSQLELFVPEIT